MPEKKYIEIIEDSLIPFPQSVDSQLWNDRVEDLIERINEYEKKKQEDSQREQK